MTNFAIVENGSVVNVIVADSLDVAKLFFDQSLIVEETEATGIPAIGFELDSAVGRFVPACYNAGWMFNKENWSWEPPVAYPQDGKLYDWDNASQDWVKYDPNSVITIELPEAPTE